MIGCSELTRMVASDALADAPWWRRAAVRLHLLMCRHCRGYVQQIDMIGKEVRQTVAATDADEAALERLEQTLGSDPNYDDS